MVTEPPDGRPVGPVEPGAPAKPERAPRRARHVLTASTSARSRIHACVQRLLEACARPGATHDARCVQQVIEDLRRLLPNTSSSGHLAVMLKQWTKRQPLYWSMSPAGRHLVDRVIADLRTT